MKLKKICVFFLLQCGFLAASQSPESIIAPGMKCVASTYILVDTDPEYGDLKEEMVRLFYDPKVIAAAPTEKVAKRLADMPPDELGKKIVKTLKDYQGKPLLIIPGEFGIAFLQTADDDVLGDPCCFYFEVHVYDTEETKNRENVVVAVFAKVDEDKKLLLECCYSDITLASGGKVTTKTCSFVVNTLEAKNLQDLCERLIGCMHKQCASIHRNVPEFDIDADDGFLSKSVLRPCGNDFFSTGLFQCEHTGLIHLAISNKRAFFNDSFFSFNFKIGRPDQEDYAEGFVYMKLAKNDTVFIECFYNVVRRLDAKSICVLRTSDVFYEFIPSVNPLPFDVFLLNSVLTGWSSAKQKLSSKLREIKGV